MYLDVVVSSDDLLIDYIVFRELDAYLDLFLHVLLVMAGVVAKLIEDVPFENVLAVVRDVILRKLVIVAVVEDVVATVVIGDVWGENVVVTGEDGSLVVVENVVVTGDNGSIAAIEKVVVVTGNVWSIVVAENFVFVVVVENVVSVVVATGKVWSIVAVVENVVDVLFGVVVWEVVWIIEDVVTADIFVGLVDSSIILYRAAENIDFSLFFRRIQSEHVSS